MKRKIGIGTAALLVLAVALAGLAGCGGGSAGASTTTTAAAAADSTTAAADASGGIELALVTDLGTIDDKSFNQGSWEGLEQYATEKNLSHKYFQPTEKSDDAYLNAIDLAVKSGAKLVVTPGYLFEVPVFIAQDRYPDVSFVLIDGSPHNEDYSEYKTGPKTIGVTYAEEQAGFLAGYAAVKDGMTSLGFMGGMAVPAVIRYGYGYVQGANVAAEELGLADGAITLKYNYTGGFTATPEAQAQAASWYNEGVEVIFGCGGAVGNSVMAAAEQAGKKVIGVDVDQSPESSTVITSAMKGLRTSVYDCVKAYKEGGFRGGEDIVFDAANDGVGLAMDTAKFEKFTQADYDAIYAKLKDGSVVVHKDQDDAGNDVAVTELDVPKVAVTEV